MGSTESSMTVVDYSPNSNFSEKHNISAWTKFKPKNDDYYKGNRFCKISRSLYPQYTRGYLWGYYEDTSYYAKKN